MSGRGSEAPGAVNRDMRKITRLVVHCSATMEGKPFTAADIDAMHRRRGFRKIGYHFVIGLKGERWTGRALDEVGAHVEGHNADSIGICYIGGIGADGKAKDTRTPEQKAELKKLLDELAAQFPGAAIRGHRDLSPDRDGDGVVEPHEWLKMCPCFDVAAWCRSVCIDPK